MRRSPRQDCLANIPSTITNQLPLRDLLRPNKVVSNQPESSEELGFTRNTKQKKSQEVVDLKDVDWSEMAGVSESDSDEDHQVEEGGETEDCSTD